MGNQPPRVLLAGSKVTLSLTAQPGARVAWVLAYGKNVLAEGSTGTDKDGLASVRLTMPDVRVRTECRLHVQSAGATASTRIALLPRRLLSRSAERLKELGIGVLDATGRLARALTDEGVSAEAMAPDLTRDYFSGGLVILAGFERPERLTWACEKFTSRVDNGMTALIINPPAGFSSWGIKIAKFPQAKRGRLSFAPEFGRVLRAEDLGDGPWRQYVSGDCQSELVRLEVAEEQAGKDAPASEPKSYALVAASRLGRGLIIVAAIPQLDAADSDAVGRYVLNEIVLWIIAEHRDNQQEPDDD